MQLGRRILRTALIAGSAVALTAGASVLALASGPAAQASPTCAAAWSSTTVYTAGDQASEDGTNYTANWWTEGNDPATNNGGSGSGEPWTSDGSCTADSGSGSGSGSGGGSIGTAVFSSLAATQSRTISMPRHGDNPRQTAASKHQLISNSLPSGSRMATP